MSPHGRCTRTRHLLLAVVLCAPGPIGAAQAEDTDPRAPMDVDGLHAFVADAAPDFERQGTVWQFTLGERQMLLIADPNADRMRLMSPVASAESLSNELQYRTLQANFDTTLDARYAIANEIVWSVYIHPLSPLDRSRLSDAALQVWTAAATFGTTFTAGSFHFGGGDSNEELEQRREELRKQLEPTA